MLLQRRILLRKGRKIMLYNHGPVIPIHISQPPNPLHILLKTTSSKRVDASLTLMIKADETIYH
jgi:hypothetical protein